MKTMDADKFREWVMDAVQDYIAEVKEDGEDVEKLPKREWIDDFIDWLDQHGND